MSAISCHLQGISLDRAHEFVLSIPDLSISTQGTEGVNKMPFMGESGAGKSTLLNVMSAIEWPIEGTVTWTFPDGKSIHWDNIGPSVSDVRLLRRKYFGFAFQDSTLMMHLQVCENLTYPLLFKGVSKKDAREIAWEKLDQVLLESERKYKNRLFRQYPARLSGGQRQRVALMQAMIHDPCVLFADEPTGSLDRDTRKQVMDVLYTWVNDTLQQQDRLLLWVTHHENDPRDANVQWVLRIHSGKYQRLPFDRTERRDDPDNLQVAC